MTSPSKQYVRLAVFTSVVHCALSVPGTGATPAFTGLGFASGSTASNANDVSADGSVVVGSSRFASGFEPFRWTASTGMQPVGTFQGNASGTSGDGLTVVGTGNFGSALAYRWTVGGGLQILGDLPGGVVSSFGNAVSADGSTVVGESQASNGNQAFRWTSATGLQALINLPGGVNSGANDVSGNGAIVVGSLFHGPPLTSEAFRWTSTTGMQGLGFLPGALSSGASAISADGSTIVGSSASGNEQEAFRWTSAGGMQGLGDLKGGQFLIQAHDVSGDGSIVVGEGLMGVPGGSVAEAFLWSSADGMRNLREFLVADLGLDLTGWRLESANSISADGTTIVGYGYNPAGQTEAWIAVIPEPSATLFTGLLALVSPRRRHH